ncbi:MAG: MFS transporter [Chloroflexota bacterium]
MSSPKLPLYAMAFGNFAVGIGSLVIAGVIEPIAAEFQVELSAIGQLITVYALAYAISSPLIIAFTGGIPRRLMLAIGLGLALFGNGLAALAPNYTIMYVARIITALGAAIFTPLAAAVAAALTEPQNRGKAIALVFAGFSAATAIGVPLGTYVGLNFGWRITFVAVAVLALVGTVLVYQDLPAHIATPPVNLASFGHVLRQGPLLIILLVTLIQLAAQISLFAYITPFISQLTALGTTGITLLFLANGTAGFAGNFIGGDAADRIGPRRTMLVFLLLLIVALTALPLIEQSLALGVALIILWGVVGLGFQAPQQTRLVQLAPQLSSAVLGMNASFLYLGISLGSYLGGIFVNRGAILQFNWLSGGLAAAAFAVFLVTWSIRPKTTQSST